MANGINELSGGLVMRSKLAVLLIVAMVGGIIEGPVATGQQGGSRIVVAQGLDADTLDPIFAQSRLTLNIFATIFETLVQHDNEMRYRPLLAESWKTLSPTIWQFKLRRGVRFHDNELFNAAAVKYSIDRLYDPVTKAPNFLKGFVKFDRVDILDEYTVNMVTKEPAPLMLEWLLYLPILAPKYYAQLNPAQAALRPIGTGPYAFKEWLHDDHVTVVLSPNYWGRKPQIQTIIFRPVPEYGARTAELLSGGADLIVNVPPDQVDRIERSPIASVKTVEGGRDIFVGMRNDRPEFKDRRVRQAMNYAVDVDTILKSLLAGKGRRMSTLVNAYANPNLKPYPYDPVKAKALLAEADWKVENNVLMKDGKPFGVTFDTPVARYTKDKEIAEAVASYLQRIGVQVRLSPLAWPVYAGKMFQDVNPADMFLLGAGSSFDGQDEIRYVQKDFAYNPTFWNNSEFETLYAQLNREVDANKRKDLLYKLQEIVYNEAPIIFLYKQIDYYGVSKRLQNWEPRRDEIVVLSNAFVKP